MVVNIALGTSLLQVHGSTGFTLAILGLLTSAWVYGGAPLDCRRGSRGCGRDAVLVPWNYNSDNNLSSKDQLGQYAEEFTSIHHEWTGVVLFGQALLFVFPLWFWTKWNQANGIIILRASSLSTSKLSNFTRVSALLLCEVLCCANAIAQSVIINSFFESAFTRHGTRVFSWTWTSAHYRNDSFIRAYPRRLKCSYADQRSPSGQRHEDDFCWVNLSPLVEKIYMVSWFWFVLLAVASSLVLLFHGSLWIMSCRGPCRIIEKDRNVTHGESESMGLALV